MTPVLVQPVRPVRVFIFALCLMGFGAFVVTQGYHEQIGFLFVFGGVCIVGGGYVAFAALRQMGRIVKAFMR